MLSKYELLEWTHIGLSKRFSDNEAFIKACEMLIDITKQDINDSALLEMGICPACNTSGWLIEDETEIILHTQNTEPIFTEVDIRCLNCGEGFILLCDTAGAGPQAR